MVKALKICKLISSQSDKRRKAAAGIVSWKGAKEHGAPPCPTKTPVTG
jgi:hypothetical protein